MRVIFGASREMSLRGLFVLIPLAVAFGSLLAVGTARAQSDCDSQSGSNQGARTSHTCFYGDCWGGGGACEEDVCDVNCPSGQIRFCVALQYCGMWYTSGCHGFSCT